MKKIYFLLCLCIALLCTASISAETVSGSCGDAIAWSLDTETGVVVISGSGKMENYDSLSTAPWTEYHKSIRSVVLSEGVTAVGENAFSNCTALTSVTIADSVETIAYCAFGECTNLTALEFGNGVKEIGMYAFQHCIALESVTIPSCVDIIGEMAFDYCKNLSSLTIENGVTTIGMGAFYDCDALTEISLPDSVTTLGKGAFWFCDALTSVTLGSGLTMLSSEVFRNCAALKNVTLGENITYIDADAFMDCGALVTITVPDSVRIIDHYAFRGCTALSSITLNPHTAYIEASALEDCTELTIYGYSPSYAEEYANESGYPFVSLGESPLLTSGTCGKHYAPDIVCFLYKDGSLVIEGSGPMQTSDLPWTAYQSSVRSVTIEDGVTSIPFSAFSHCTNLISITIPESVASIGNWAFYKSTDLTIHGYTDSYAHRYATENNIPFVSVGVHTHAYTGRTTISPWCTRVGEKTFTCICGLSYTEELPMLAHAEIKHAAKAPTCTAIGWNAYVTCANCTSYSTYVELPVLGHAFGEWTVTKKATVYAEGERTRVCGICGATEIETIPMVQQGDMNGDGAIGIDDVLVTLKAILRGHTLENADMNGDGEVTLIDILHMLKVGTQ